MPIVWHGIERNLQALVYGGGAPSGVLTEFLGCIFTLDVKARWGKSRNAFGKFVQDSFIHWKWWDCFSPAYYKLDVFDCLHLSTIPIADFILSTEDISSSESTKMQCWHNSHFAERHRDRFQQALPSWLSDQCTGSLCNLGRTLERADLSLRSSRSQTSLYPPLPIPNFRLSKLTIRWWVNCGIWERLSQ